MTALTVLVVEDDAMIGMLLAEMLQDMGYGVCSIAATEDEAVADAAQYKPGLLIVDASLREGTGVAAVERILRNGPVPCVFISGSPVHLARPAAACCKSLSWKRTWSEQFVTWWAAPTRRPCRCPPPDTLLCSTETRYPNVNPYALTTASKNSISNVRSATAPVRRTS